MYIFISGAFDSNNLVVSLSLSLSLADYLFL